MRVASNHMIVNGLSMPVETQVRTWHETGLFFPAAAVRRSRTSLVVLHWTGSENAAPAVCENMRNRVDARGNPDPVSVHFVIDHLGVVYQMADAVALCAHAAGVNDRAVGVEIISRGDDPDVPTRGVARDKVTELIQGRTVTYAAFTPLQVTSALRLVEALCAAFELPMRVPMRIGDVASMTMPARELASFRGVIGHYHVKGTKRDPGLRMMRAVHMRGEMLRARGGGVA